MSIFQASAATSCPILRRRRRPPHKPSCSRHHHPSAAAFAFHIPPRLYASAKLIIHCSRSVDQLTQADPPPPPLLQHTTFEGTKERIRKLFHHKEVELSVSSYDTAWVALLPSPSNNSSDPPTPCFPQCLHWLLENQLPDGSWGPPLRHPLLLKDALSSTLASIIALQRWGVGQQQINRGLHFLVLNFASATDKDQHSPFGFDIIFAGLLEYATNLNLALPIEPTDLNVLLRMREFELKRCYESHSRERELYLAYVSEGLGSSQNWEMVMKHQMKNGSIFNSPSTTAAALMHHHNAGCLDYLSSLLEKFGNAVPTVYPLDLYAHLCMVDNLERLGIGRHFRMEIRSILDETYRCWLQEDEQIFTDVATCAMAFRLLRMNGYDVSSDTLSDIANKKDYVTSLGGHFKDLSAALEVYRASEMIIYHDELTLGELNSRSSHFLKQKLSDTSFPSDGLTKHIIQEVNEALKFPFNAVLERMASRSYIEHYNVESTRILKTSFCFSNISNKDFLKLALEDYNACQSIYQEELEYLERWVVENSLDKLKFARQKAAYCYFSAAATLYSPELSDARMSWAKNGVLTTVVDDFFDIGGSMEELVNLIQLVEKWDVNIDEDCYSEPVRIMFLALQRSICEIGEHALKWQARSVTGHVIEIWLDLMNSMLREAVWVKDGCVPKLDEYMENGCVSFALGPIILPALYLVGPKLGEDVVRSSEYEKLFKLVSSIGRLWNDIQSFKREFEEGKLNAVGLGMITGNEVAEEEAVVVQKMKNTIESKRRELLGLVLQEKGSVVPRGCKDLFWNMNQIVNLFYANDDGFTSHAMINIVNSILHNPISLPPSLPEL